MKNQDDRDPEFKRQLTLIPGGERLTNCLLCGTCAAECPVSEINEEFNPRKIMSKIFLGMKKEIMHSPEIWLCNQCQACVPNCPQDVRFAGIIRALRQMMIEEGYATQEMAEMVDKIDRDSMKERIEKITKVTHLAVP